MCEGTTGWAAVGGTLANQADVYIQASGGSTNFAIQSYAASALNRGADCTISATNMTGQCIFFWMAFSKPGIIGAYGSTGIRLRLTDSLGNWREWYVFGSSGTIALPHGGWLPWIVDLSLTRDAASGTEGNLSDTVKVGWRADAVTAKGTIYFDAWRYGTGLKLTGGTFSAPATWEEIFAADNLEANKYGVIMKFEGVYFIQGQIQIGDSGQTVITYFKDISQIIMFKDAKVSSSFYSISVVGAASYKTTCLLGSTSTTSYATATRARASDVATITTALTHGFSVGDVVKVVGLGGTGYNGNWTIVSASGTTFTYTNSGGNEGQTADTGGVTKKMTGMSGISGCLVSAANSAKPYTLTATDANISFFGLYGSTFLKASTITLPSNPVHDVYNCTFGTGAKIISNTTTVFNCNFISSPGIAITYNVNLTYCTFISCATGVEITTAGNKTFVALRFSGCTYDVKSSNALTVSNTYGSNAQTYDPSGSEVTFETSVTLTLTGLIAGSEIEIVNHGTQVERAREETSGTSYAYPYNWTASIYVDIFIHKETYEWYVIWNYLLPSDNMSIPISQRFDRVYSNP